ncbi:hypothetical protein Ddc_00431 [Ditylenchus destructor]|nr:hypothetical protein Ddc_00431 [Ditylenchus destructor]
MREPRVQIHSIYPIVDFKRGVTTGDFGETPAAKSVVLVCWSMSPPHYGTNESGSEENLCHGKENARVSTLNLAFRQQTFRPISRGQELWQHVWDMSWIIFAKICAIFLGSIISVY